METVLQGSKAQVKISSDGPFVIIGEKINPTGRKELAEALRRGDLRYVQQMAVDQVQAGADVLDLNVGLPGVDEVALLPRVVQAVGEVVDVPLCLDSANGAALGAALTVAPGRPLVNSVNGKEAVLEAILPLVREHRAAVIGLTMDDTGIPKEPEARLAVADKILQRAVRYGIPAEDVIIDPLVLTVGADSRAAAVTLRTIELLRRELGVNINLGASNVSFGLPERPTLNLAFLALATGAGATCAITDPSKMTLAIRAVDLLLGRDPGARRYLAWWRRMKASTTPQKA